MKKVWKNKEETYIYIPLAIFFNTFELRQTIQRLVPESSLISEVWIVPLGLAIIAPTPTKATTILQAKTKIEKRFGNATVKRQKTWKKFVIDSIHKQKRCLNGFRNPIDGLLWDELGFLQESVPIRYVNWARQSQNDEPTSYLRLCAPKFKSSKFPSRLPIISEAVSI